MEASGAAGGGAGDLCVCGGGGFDWELPGELLWAAGYCGVFGEDGGEVCFAVLGRGDGGAVYRLVAADEGRTSTVLGTAAVVACGLVATSILTHGHTAMWAIIAVGLFNSVMFPSIFTVGLTGLGPLTRKGSSLMVAAIVGGALIPLAEGHLADAVGVQHAFMIPAVCYIYIALFGYLGGRRAEREVGDSGLGAREELHEEQESMAVLGMEDDTSPWWPLGVLASR